MRIPHCSPNLTTPSPSRNILGSNILPQQQLTSQAITSSKSRSGSKRKRSHDKENSWSNISMCTFIRQKVFSFFIYFHKHTWLNLKLKLFLLTSYFDHSVVEQSSIMNDDARYVRLVSKLNLREFWDTLTLTIVQRPKY